MNLDALVEIVEEQRTSLLRDLQSASIISDEMLESSEPQSPLFNELLKKAAFEKLTNFSKDQLLSIYQSMEKTINSFTRRGKKPKIGHLDSLICYLMFFKSGITLDSLSGHIGCSISSVEKAMLRIRPILQETLKEKWNMNSKSIPRPSIQRDKPLPFVGLLIDATTTEVYRPKGRFEEAKVYWDGKNCIYGLKKEVAVLGYPPYFAVSSSKAAPGSIHDFLLLKEGYKSYLPFLQKTPEEKIATATMDRAESWMALLDKGYYGADASTPGLRKMTPKKGTCTVAELRLNEQVSQQRVYVECFFGRMQGLWRSFQNVYRLDHVHFDADFDICLWLTNEHISFNNGLQHAEGEFYTNNLKRRLYFHEEHKAKKRLAYERWRESRKRRREEASASQDTEGN